MDIEREKLMFNLFNPFPRMSDAEVREAAWDFYAMGNERAALRCVLELAKRDPEGTAAWAAKIFRG